MAYRNKTYVAFASEDIRSYRLMEAWRENANIDFDFFDAHDLFVARDTSSEDTIRHNLRNRMSNAKQIIVLISDTTQLKAGRRSFLQYEIELIAKLNLPVVFANINGSRHAQEEKLPFLLKSPYYTMSVSLQSKIIKYALDNYVSLFNTNSQNTPPFTGAYEYKPSVYVELGL